MKNITYRGFSSFIKALRKHVLAGTYANFWTEVHSKKHALVHSKFTLAGEPQTIVYMNQLVDRMIEKMTDITEQEMLDVINQVIRISFVYESKYWFMVSVNEAEQATIEALEATDVLPEEDNGVQDNLGSLELAKEITAELAGTLSEEDKATFVEAASREDELKALTIKELRVILKARDVRFAPAHKEAKLIELILGSD